MDNSYESPQKPFPFRSRLNLAGLMGYWEINLQTNDTFGVYPTEKILKQIRDAEALRNPIDDLGILKKHERLVGMMMSAIMPTAMLDSQLSAALIPFSFEGFYSTPGFRKILPLDKIRRDIVTNFKDNDMESAKIFRACVFILNKFYGTDVQIDEPILISIPDTDTGLLKAFKVELNVRFIDVIQKGELAPISPEQISLLMADRYNIPLWLDHIDVDNFEFQGFTICNLVEVTENEMLSKIKYDLLNKDAVISEEHFHSIQQKIRSIFRLPEMQLGLSFFDIENNLISNQGLSSWNSFMIPTREDKLSCDYFRGSVYDMAHTMKRPVIIEDLEKMKNRSRIEDDLLEKGIKNIAIAPLIQDGDVIGILELGTPYAGKLNALSAAKLEATLPMFTTAVNRALAEMRMAVRALIQEECTAIHPSVEWRFLQEGYRILSNGNRSNHEEFDNIVFPNVYPLYGMSDIRNSSVERSKAIQADLMQSLKEAKNVIDTISEVKDMPILSELRFRLDREIGKIGTGLNSGDESSVIAFLKEEIMTAFGHFKMHLPEVKEKVEKYESMLEPGYGVIYDKRKEFEESLTMINETISAYLDEAEAEAQTIFPHYFEKYKTDGVEYNIYMGQSMVKNGIFDMLYLHNFRLWQLIVMCEIAHRVHHLQHELPRPLEITQLILAHGEPLSVKFRKDEKHFDVDGAYNIRYEIVKKRIDKALVKNTAERLTQPGKIAVVYSREKEALEYHRYINYLQSIHYLTDEVESLELEELQGAQGLRALRVSVNKKTDTEHFGNQVIRNVMEAMEV